MLFLFIVLKRNKKKFPTKPNDIIQIVAARSSCEVHTDSNGRFIQNYPLSFYETLLALSGLFVRVHDSYLINATRVTSYDNTEAMLDKVHRVPITPKGYALLNKYYQEHPLPSANDEEE